jgi:peptide/nickel transport system permease protein
MKFRWLHTRSARKFLKNRMTRFSLGIISLYVLTTLALFGGAVTLEETETRIAAGNVPGFWGHYPLEQRFADTEMYLDAVKRALSRNDVASALSEITYGHLRIGETEEENVRELLDQANRLFDELAVIENLNESPEHAARVQEIELILSYMFAPLSATESISRDLRLSLGTDRQGRSILLRGVYSIKVALLVGMVTATIGVLIGSLLGAAAGWFGGWTDNAIIWLYTTFQSIPNIVLLVLLAYLFTGSRFEGTLLPLYVSFGATYWIGPCRVIRGETLKLKELEYIQAAQTMGFSRFYILLRHILPNASHLMLINFSLLFIGAVKSEVILSFLGLGVKEGPSWGIMISQASSEVVNGFFWQIGTATVLMFGLVLAFNIVSDSLQDAFDPKHAGD